MAEERSGDFQRRLPAVERNISDIKQDDIRVRVIGTVLDKQGNRIVLDDGTGKVDVGFEGPPEVESGQLVRVFGRVISLENGFEIQGELVQKLDGLDMKLRKKVMELENKINLKNPGVHN